MTDVLVIGSGAGGGPFALRLSQAGFDVTVIEKGPRFDRSDFGDEEMFLPMHDQFVPSLDEEPRMLVDYRVTPTVTKRSRFGRIACCVGGGTVHMGATLLRFHPDDFRVATRCGSYEAVADWPYQYDDLEPYYAQAEWEIGVSGRAEASPFAGHRSREYPMPPLRQHPIAASFDAACRQLGLDPSATPRGVNSQMFADRPACAHCRFCSGYGCPVGARGSAAETVLHRAMATGRCVIVSGAMAREVTTDGRGRATGCIYIDATGTEQRIRSHIVCVACSAVESARLLLLSKSPRHLNGLGNITGLVGKFLQFHGASMGRGHFRLDRHPEMCLGERGAVLDRSVLNHYFLGPDVSSFVKGGVLAFELARVHPVSDACRIARNAGPLLWGRPLQARLDWLLRDTREVRLEVFQDFIPNSGTFVELDPNVVDRWGLPVARIHLREPAHHRVAGAWLVDRGLEILDAMGADEVTPGGIGYTNDVMNHGTCRAGVDPRSSVLNAYCQSHEVANLFVVDGSFMPTSGGAPSTLTIIANSLRTADFVIDRARTRDLG